MTDKRLKILLGVIAVNLTIQAVQDVREVNSSLCARYSEGGYMR